MDLVHTVGAIGCGLLAVGFGADGESGRTLFYLALTLAFAAAVVHRRQQRRTTRPVPARPAVVDLRSVRTPSSARR